VEQVDRRVQILQPIQGWCSLKSSNGDTILAPVDTDNKGTVPQTPGANADAHNKYDMFQARAEAAQQKVENTNANIKKWTNKLNPESQKTVQDLAKISEKKSLEEKLKALEAELSKQPESTEIMSDLKNAIKERQEANNQLRIFEQMGAAATKEIANLKDQYSQLFEQNEGNHSQDYFPRDVVKYKAGLAIVRWFGQNSQGEDYVGLEFSEAHGSSDGNFEGVQRFEVQPQHAEFVASASSDLGRRVKADELLQKLHLVLQNTVVSKNSRE